MKGTQAASLAWWQAVAIPEGSGEFDHPRRICWGRIVGLCSKYTTERYLSIALGKRRFLGVLGHMREKTAFHWGKPESYSRSYSLGRRWYVRWAIWDRLDSMVGTPHPRVSTKDIIGLTGQGP